MTAAFPDFKGNIGLPELRAARKLLQQGSELPREAMVRIVDRTIELQVMEHFKHVDGCAWWFGAGCNSDCRGPSEEFDPSSAERPAKAAP